MHQIRLEILESAYNTLHTVGYTFVAKTNRINHILTHSQCVVGCLIGAIVAATDRDHNRSDSRADSCLV